MLFPVLYPAFLFRAEVIHPILGPLSITSHESHTPSLPFVSLKCPPPLHPFSLLSPHTTTTTHNTRQQQQQPLRSMSPGNANNGRLTERTTRSLCCVGCSLFFVSFLYYTFFILAPPPFFHHTILHTPLAIRPVHTPPIHIEYHSNGCHHNLIP